MSYKVSEVCGCCFQFGWVEIDEENKLVKRSLTSANWAVVELNSQKWATPLFEKKLLPHFRQVSQIESAVVPSQDISPENRGKSIDVVWIDVDYIEHFTYHSEFTGNQKILALKAIFELQLVLEQNGWHIHYPHLGNMTFTPEPMMFDLGDIRRNDLCQEIPGIYNSIFTTLPKDSMKNVSGFDELVKHLSNFSPGLPSDNQKFIEEALRIVNNMKTKETETLWDNYRGSGNIPSKDNLEAFKIFQPPKSESITSVLLDLKPKTVVDVGCSDGYYSFMAESYGARSVIGIDSSEKVINSALQMSISRKSVCKFAYCDLTRLTSEFTKRIRSDFALGAAIMHHLFKAGMSFEDMAYLFASLGRDCMIEYIAPFDMHHLNQDKPGHTLENFRKAFSKYWKTIELLPTIPMGSKKYNEWFKGWLIEHPGATLEEMPRVWLRCCNRRKNSIPLVSIGMAVYNEERFIGKTIDSLLQQDFEDFELIISDNASTDRTYEICTEYKDKDQRIKLHRNETNLGGTANFKQVLNLSSGKYFMLAGGHDLWEPSLIGRCVRVLNKNSDVVLCHTKCAEIDREDKMIRIMPDSLDTQGLSIEESLPKVWLLKTGVPIYGMMRLDVLNRINHDREILGADVVMLGELCTLGSIAYINELLSYQRNPRPPETPEQSVRRTLTAINHDRDHHKISFETAWLDLFRGHMDVLNMLNISTESKSFLMKKLVECFKLNYGKLPREEVEKLSDHYIAYFGNNNKKQSNSRCLNEAKVALEYITIGLLLYSELYNLIKAHDICSSINAAIFTKRVRIAGEDDSSHDLTMIATESDFAKGIRQLFKNIRPKKIIETGTYFGTGTTTTIASSLKQLGIDDATFYSIEVNPEHYKQALVNLSRNKFLSYVDVLNGLSIQRNLLPTFGEIEDKCVKHIEFDDIFVDHQENERALLYYQETDFENLQDDLLGECLKRFDYSPDFVLLDSGGHMGNIEFNYLIDNLQGECYIALDDIYHIKHHHSFQQAQSDPRLEIITASKEKFGFCIAKFTPAQVAQKVVDDSQIIISSNAKKKKAVLIVRTDSVGDFVIFSAVLPYYRKLYPDSHVSIAVRECSTELAEACPYIDEVIVNHRKSMVYDQNYAAEFIKRIRAAKFDVAICPIYSRDKVSDFITANSRASERIVSAGNNSNMPLEQIQANNPYFTHIVPARAGIMLEVERNKEFLEGLGIVIDQPLRTTMWVEQKHKDFADRLLKELNIEKPIVVCPFAQHQMRDWPVHKWAQLISHCGDYPVVICGSGKDSQEAENLISLTNHGNIHNLCGKTTLRQLAAVLANSELCLGVESAPTHIAAAVDRPHVVIIGGGHFGRFMPYSSRTTLVYNKMDCYGCNWRCKYGQDIRCIKAITVDMVEQAVNGWLKKAAEPFTQDQKTSYKQPEEEQYLVSAIISTYNSEKFIRGCLEDLENQTISDRLEIIVVNSGSEQNEEAIIKEFQQKYDNIKYIRTNQRETVYQAWNRGIKAAAGKYITNANTDDRLREDAYERKIQILENNPHVGVIYADQWISEVPNEKFRDCKKERGLIWPEFFPELCISVCIFGSQPMWRRDLHEKYGLFDERFKSAGDFEFWSRVSDKVECSHIPDFLGVYYSNSDGIEKSYGHNASETKQIRQYYRRGLKNTKRQLSLFTDFTSVFHKIRIFRNQAKIARHRSTVSVVVPMYNSSQYIVETLESIIQQTANNFEIVMVDDGSIDDCVQKAIKCLKKTDIPATILSIPHRGSAVARNIGVFYSTGQFILPFDSDDIMMPEMVADSHNKLSSDTSLGFAYCDVEYFEDMQKIRSMGDVDVNNFMWENQAHACSMFRKTAWVDASGYYAKMKYGDEDWDLWLEMLEKGWKACHIPKPNFRYRWRKKSRTSKLISEHWAQMKSQLVLNHPDMYPEVYRRWAALENKSHYESLTVRDMTYLLLLYCAELPRWRNIYWWTEAKKKLCHLKQMLINKQQLESRVEEMSKLIDFNIQVKSNGRLTKKDKKVEVIEYARKPEISVIIPLYNHERFIEMAISSVLEQSFPNFELIIINDGSTDNSAKIVKKFNDNRIRYVSRANKGAYETINEGVRLAKGEYISILNSDDFYDKDRLKKCVNILKNNRSLAAVFSYINIIDGHGNLMDSKEGDKSNWGKIKNKITFENQVNPLLSLLAGNFLVTTSNLFCKKEIFNKIGYFRNLRYTHDYDMFLRICQNFKTYILPELLLFYRVHSSNSSKENRAEVCFEVGLLLTDFLLNNDIFHKNRIEGCYEFITKFYNSINTYGADRMILTLLVMAKYDKKFKNIFFNELINNENNLFRKSCIDEFRKILSVTSAVPKELPSTLEAENDKKVKRVLLTTSAAPTQSPFSTSEKRPPIGIGFLISVLRNAGHEVFFIDNYLQPNDFLDTDYLWKNEIDYVGIYANTICLRDTLRMMHKLEHLRQTNKWNGKIVAGGPHTTVAVNTIPDFVDYVVQGEGEQAILDIVEGKVTQRLVSYPRIENLDVLPMPAWDYFVKLPYNWNVRFFEGQPVFTMNTSRGCPFRCQFCSVGSIWGKKYTYFSAERIVSDIEYLIKNYGTKGIYFREDNFTLNKERLKRFCNLIIEKGIKISWVCESRVSNLTRDIVELMSRAGLRGFYFGVESGSQRMLDLMQKDITVEQIRYVFKWCHEFDVKTAASVIVGVPDETELDILQTNQLLKEIKPTVTWFNVFVGIPDSKLYRLTLDKKLYEYIDDRGLVYLQGHNDRVQHYYNGGFNAYIPYQEKNKDMTNRPKVSVLISAYNSEKYIEQALESIYNQTYQDFEVIIVDDGSTDRTSEILVNIKDPRTFICGNSVNKGLTKSLNIGLKLCRGEYVARMDADDISHPQRFEKQVGFLNENPECVALGSWYGRIDSNGEVWGSKETPIGYEDIKKNLPIGNCVGHGSMMLRRSSLVEIGGYNEKYTYAQDYDLLLRLSEVGEIRNLGEYLYNLRSWPGAVSATRAEQQNEYAELALQEYVEREFDTRPVDRAMLYRFADRALAQFVNSKYISCIITLNTVGKRVKGVERIFRNYDFLRGLAYFAVNMKAESRGYLNREIQNYNNAAARQFISDYFENQIEADVRNWYLENSKLYDLRLIDLENESCQQRQNNNISEPYVSEQQSEQKGIQQSSCCKRSEPLVSVIMPAYNAQKFITEAVQSVLNQTYRNFELVVVDDGSTDGTKNIVFSFKDERIKYFYHENSGLAATHNTGIKNSKGLFLVKLDSDDMMTADFIAAHLAEFEKHPDVDLVYCDDCLIEENSNPIRVIERPEYTDRRLLIRDLFHSGFPVVPFRTCIRRSVFDKIGFFDEELLVGEDYDMMRRFVKHGLKIHHLKGALYLRRMTSNSLSRNCSAQKAKSHFEVIKRFINTFAYDELFPDVAWDEIAPQMRQLHAKCLAAGTYLTIGQNYVRTKAIECSRIAFDLACSELNDCVKMDPENQGLRQLLQKSKLIRAKYTEAPQQVVS